MAPPRDQDEQATLLCGGSPVAPVRIASTLRSRYRGLLGTDTCDGALLLVHVNGVHTFGMRYPIDVVYLSAALRVVRVITMRPGRIALPWPRCRHTLEAEAGNMERWGIEPGADLVTRS